MSDIDQLTQDLFWIYQTAGREVTYIDKHGNRRAYWPNRYLQAVKRAVEQDEVVAFVERLVSRDDATRGFGYLQDAGRLDLTVEALVADETKPYHHLFTENAVVAAKARLLEASGLWQFGNKLADLRTERDRLDAEIREGEALLAFAEENGYDDLTDARIAFSQQK